MGTAYTPGLTVSGDQVLTRRRRLPVAGELLVEQGDAVAHDTVVARAELPGDIETIRLAEHMGLDPEELEGKLRVAVGDTIRPGQLLAESAGIFGLFRSEAKASIAGTVEFFTKATGHLGVRRAPRHVEVTAYVDGIVASVEASESVLVRTRGAFIQGIFGIGGERHGRLRMAAAEPSSVVVADDLDESLAGTLLVAGAGIDLAAVQRAASLGVAGVVVGAVADADLAAIAGREIGVAITGDEDIPLTLILTEGFGRIPMARRTFELLGSLEGRFAAVNGATQIRAGAIRPEIIVPRDDLDPASEASDDRTADLAFTLREGTSVRAVRQPYFGLIGTVSALPPDPVAVETGARVRVLAMTLSDGTEIVLPRSNVEIIET